MTRRRAQAALREVEDSRDRILDAAIALCARHGVAGVSLSLLADHVGLHKSTLFHHFTSKGELAEAALRRAVEPLAAIVEPLGRAGAATGLEALVEVALALDDHFARDPASARFLLRAIVGPVEELEVSRDVERRDHPVQRLFRALGTWLFRARRAGTVRRVRVRHAVVNLLGLALLYPAIRDDLGREIFAGDPDDGRSRRARREELAGMLRAALGPERSPA